MSTPAPEAPKLDPYPWRDNDGRKHAAFGPEDDPSMRSSYWSPDHGFSQNKADYGPDPEEPELGTPTGQLEALVAKYPSDRGAWRRALESVFHNLDIPEGYTTPTHARIKISDHRFGQPHDGVLYCTDKGCNTSITVEAYGQDAFGNVVW